jgi:hypothetical protein
MPEVAYTLPAARQEQPLRWSSRDVVVAWAVASYVGLPGDELLFPRWFERVCAVAISPPETLAAAAIALFGEFQDEGLISALTMPPSLTHAGRRYVEGVLRRAAPGERARWSALGLVVP